MLIALAAILVGFIILTWSADRFVAGAAATASNMNVSRMLIGLTVVSIGTSAPEILVSLMAALQGFPGLAVGNAMGSNIANIGLVLGVTALIAPLPVKAALAKREIPLLVVISLVAGLCIANGYLGRIDGLILLAGLFITLYLMIRWQKQHPDEPLVEDEEIPELSPAKAWLMLGSGLLLLLGSSQLLVWGATEIAKMMGISDLVIGLTIVAIGTSLPELAASVTSALKGHHDIALGNVIGSNIFNLLAVLSMPGLVAPGALDKAVILRDYPVMLGMTLLLALLCLIGKKPRQLGKVTGVALLSIYALYGAWLFIQN
ncbi:calcium/sodium antiporter [Endozoicomonas sp. 4G]|uniref:calcium/sodium antiporter n=1 Tax=Endozoicomonas sp. 4G TaxID=2872754 RepID=UPI002078C24A|nr:calcium/sodium antiporter [Endozoicomonas sp. 4G]